MAVPSTRICSTSRFDRGNLRAERKTWWVVALTLVTMLLEISAGLVTQSMALLADGWHMGTHAIALGLTAGAYVLARRFANDGRFAFGTWKIEILASFSSALLLAVVATLMVFESVLRLLDPVAIAYTEALAVAVLGLAVNLVSVWLLREGHQHGHEAHGPHEHGQHAHSHADAHEHRPEFRPEFRQAPRLESGSAQYHDLNLRGAYLHVLADAATSLAAIGALIGGLLFDWRWLDPAVGCVGAALIFYWAFGLLRESGTVLLDREMDTPLVEQIRSALQAKGSAEIRDFHLWRVGRNQYACIISLETDNGSTVADYKSLLACFPELAHLTLEVTARVPAESASTAN